MIVALLSFPLFAEWHQYDQRNRKEKWALTKDREIECTYDVSGNRTEWKDWTGTTQFSFDVCNHLEGVIAPDGCKTVYKHDARGNLLQMIYPSGVEVGYTYGRGGVLNSVIVQQKEVAYSYNSHLNLLVKRKLPSGVTTEYLYDHARRMSDIIHTNPQNNLIAHFHFEYDDEDRVTALDFPTGRMKYVYSEIGQISQVVDLCGNVTAFEYDGVGKISRVEDAEGNVLRYGT